MRVMARSAATLMDATLAISVTGEAGPDTQETETLGTVWFGVVDHGTCETEKQFFSGEPETIVSASVKHAIGVLPLHATAITTS